MSKGHFITFLVIALPFSCVSQGTFVYDQQSSVEGVNGEVAVNVQLNQPLGQSFTPTLSSLDFIRLNFLNAGVGGSVFLNVRSNSISGVVVATSLTAILPDAFKGYQDFVFSGSVTLTPEVPYFFEPVVQSGTGWFLSYHNGFAYTRGNAIFLGAPQTVNDLWFREGIIVPEPSSVVLILAGLAMTRFVRKSRK